MTQTLHNRDAGATADGFEAHQRVAAGYTRQSKAKSDKSEASPQTQDESTEKKARERGCSFKGHYRDIGVSGYSPNAKRKAFERLLNDCRDGEIQEIVVFNITRFSRREPKDMIPVVLELFSLGVTITSVAEGSFTPDNTMELMMLIWRLEAAHQDSKNKSEAVSGAKRKAQQFGGWTGGTPPYGMESYAESVTRVLDGKPVTITIRLLRPVPKQDDGLDQGSIVVGMVDTIFEHKDEPYDGKKNAHPGSINSLTTGLNVRRIKTQHGGLWRTPTVKRVLSDPRIAGMAGTTVYRTNPDGTKSRTIAGYKILRGEDGEPIMIGEGLITPARWFELQEWLAGRGRGQAPHSQCLMTAMDLFHCECARPMTGSTPVYKCSRPMGVSIDGQHQGGNIIQQAEVDDAVARRIMAVIRHVDESDPETASILAEATRRYAERQENPEHRGQRKTLVGERAGVLKAIEQLYADLRMGIYDGDIGRAQFLSEKEDLEARRQALDARLGEVGGPGVVELPIASWTETDEPGGDPLGEGSWWAGASMDERRKLVQLFVDDVVITKATYRGGTGRTVRVDERVHITMASPRVREHAS